MIRMYHSDASQTAFARAVTLFPPPPPPHPHLRWSLMVYSQHVMCMGQRIKPKSPTGIEPMTS